MAYFTAINPEIIGNDYRVIGTLDRAEWKRKTQEEPSSQEVIEYLHDFKEALTFKLNRKVIQ